MTRIAALLVVAALAAGCGNASAPSLVPGADPKQGAKLIEHYGCGVSVATPTGSLTPGTGECIDWRYDPHPSLFALDYNVVLGAHPWLGAVQDDRAQYSDATIAASATVPQSAVATIA